MQPNLIPIHLSRQCTFLKFLTDMAAEEKVTLLTYVSSQSEQPPYVNGCSPNGLFPSKIEARVPPSTYDSPVDAHCFPKRNTRVSLFTTATKVLCSWIEEPLTNSRLTYELLSLSHATTQAELFLQQPY